MDFESDDPDEALMDDTTMMVYLRDALESGDVARVMAAAQRVVRVRDHREVTIREFIRWNPEEE